MNQNTTGIVQNTTDGMGAKTTRFTVLNIVPAVTTPIILPVQDMCPTGTSCLEEDHTERFANSLGLGHRKGVASNPTGWCIGMRRFVSFGGITWTSVQDAKLLFPLILKTVPTQLWIEVSPFVWPPKLEVCWRQSLLNDWECERLWHRWSYSTCRRAEVSWLECCSMWH